MKIEKVKEIKKALKCCIKLNNTKYTDRERQLACISCPYANKDECDVIISKNCLTLINELESENKELKKYKLDWLNGEKMHLQAEMEETEFELYCVNKALKKRIAELEKENAKYKRKLTTNQWVQEIRKEALKQFAEMLKNKFDHCVGGIYHIYHAETIDERIDETLKEAINEKKNP